MSGLIAETSTSADRQDPALSGAAPTSRPGLPLPVSLSLPCRFRGLSGADFGIDVWFLRVVLLELAVSAMVRMAVKPVIFLVDCGIVEGMLL